MNASNLINLDLDAFVEVLNFTEDVAIVRINHKYSTEHFKMLFIGLPEKHIPNGVKKPQTFCACGFEVVVEKQNYKYVVLTNVKIHRRF